ncbi:MAG: flagellar biosynthetic protein FliR [Negativicutes bacterium]|nr:flagellar biosynthetic protein FliR [Negativicutes bacterium]
MSALLNQTNFFLLIFARVSGIFTAAPFYNNSNVPPYCKAGAALLISYILLPLTYNPRIPIPETFWPYIALVAGEFLFGLIFGFVSYLIFQAVQMAGNLLDLQIGFGVVNVFDPQFGQQVPLLGNFQFILAMIVFMATNGHHILLAALFASFKVIPVTGLVFHASLADFIVNLFVDIFIIAFKLTLPVLVALVLTDVALAILARTMPQMNIFIVGVPAKIAVGLFTLAVALPFYIAFLEVGFNEMYQSVYRLLAAFR